LQPVVEEYPDELKAQLSLDEGWQPESLLPPSDRPQDVAMTHNQWTTSWRRK
jgi:hypothetical protein